MLCENCGLKNVSSIFLPSGETKLKYLCGECYKKANSDLELENLAYIASKNVEIDAVCKACGMTFAEFKESGLFGCTECYNTFNDYIKDKILPNFKEQKYLGKKPNMYYIREDIKHLENLIELCLKKGDLTRATLYGKELEKLKETYYDQL